MTVNLERYENTGTSYVFHEDNLDEFIKSFNDWS